MSLVVPPLFHWAPSEVRPKIERRGLKPTCAYSVAVSSAFIAATGGAGHHEYDDDMHTLRTVCLGLTPSHAWSLSGMASAERGSTWDLWQVTLDDGDEVHPLPFLGWRLDEIRVANRIPKPRVWYVASRYVKLTGSR